MVAGVKAAERENKIGGRRRATGGQPFSAFSMEPTMLVMFSRQDFKRVLAKVRDDMKLTHKRARVCACVCICVCVCVCV